MIDYNNIAKSIDFYTGYKFARIESPWTVTDAISNITKPPGCQNFTLTRGNKIKVLVASGEQSFLYLYAKGFLPPGMFQTVTPCFRDEVFDDIHTKYFIKNELIRTDNATSGMIAPMIDMAMEFFGIILGSGRGKLDVEDVGQDGQRDIVFVYTDKTDNEVKRIELGSYGLRRTSYLKWVYGTGCAEPRLSHVVRLHKES